MKRNLILMVSAIVLFVASGSAYSSSAQQPSQDMMSECRKHCEAMMSKMAGNMPGNAAQNTGGNATQGAPLRVTVTEQGFQPSRIRIRLRHEHAEGQDRCPGAMT